MITINFILSALIFRLCFGNEETILELHDENFNSTVANHTIMLVMFYAPWCIHCRNLKPKFEAAAEFVKIADIPLTLARMDCTDGGKNTCKQNHIDGIPALKIYRSGKYHQDYKGGKEAQDIIDYFKAEIGKCSREIKKYDDLEDMLSNGESVVLGVFKNASDLKSEFLEAAGQLSHRFAFAHTSKTDILEGFLFEDNVVIVLATELRNKFEDSFKIFKGNSNYDEIYNFIKKNYYGLVGHRKGTNRSNFGFPIVIAYYRRNNKTDNRGFFEWKQKLLEIAIKYSHNITFAVSPRSVREFKEYGISYEDDDSDILVARDGKNRKFVYSDDFYTEEFEQFIDDVLKGKLKPFWISESIPKNNNGPVKTAVARNFEDVVLSSDRDTFIGFYAPWCPHCRSVAVDFEMLGELLKHEDVDVVKMDATANDIPYPFEVTAYPTGYWVSKDAKNLPVKYEGNHTLQDVLKFIAAHATKELKNFNRRGEEKTKDEF